MGYVFLCWRANNAPMTQRALILTQQTKWFEGRHVCHLLGLPSLQKCVCEIFGEIWFGIRFEIWNVRWEKSGEILGDDFSSRQESTKNFGANFGANFGEYFGENFGNFVSNFATVFGSFVQQKGGANICVTNVCARACHTNVAYPPLRSPR